MKKAFLLIVTAILVYGYIQDQGILSTGSSAPSTSNSVIEQAYENQQSDVQVKGEGTVIKLLRDDRDGSRHQRFILELASGHTLLLSHNIDLAPRIDRLKSGDRVEFFGEYEWNDKGGVVHWTHHDPAGRHASGWIRHQGRTYQ